MHILIIYIGIFLGVFIEGEMVMISAIIAAHHGHLNLWIVVVLGIVATYCSDIFYFNIGRKKGTVWLNKQQKFKSKIEIVNEQIKKYPIIVFLSYRFLYGFRTITPMVIGTSKTNSITFFIFSAISILIWAATYCTIGYIFGGIIKSVLGHIEHIEFYIIGIILFIAIFFVVFKQIRTKQQNMTIN